MPFDAHANLAISTVTTPPSPASSGTTLTVTAGEGARFPAVPFNATVWPADAIPTPLTAEVVRVTAIAVNTFTIVRAQEGTTARAILPGDLIAATITAKTITDVEKLGLREFFRGLRLEPNPDLSLAPSSVLLSRADGITMHDGEYVPDWAGQTAALTAAGAGGLDTGAEVASAWYEVHAIRKSVDNTRSLLFHLARSYTLDQNLATGDDGQLQILEGARVAIGQGITPALTGPCQLIDLNLQRLGVVGTGRIWVELQTSSGGLPTDTVLATSDKLDAAGVATVAQWIRFQFRTPATLTAGTPYQIVVKGDWTPSSTDTICWRSDASAPPYAGGTGSNKTTSWLAQGTTDYLFRQYSTQNEQPVTMPAGYDQRCRISFVYNDASSNLIPFVAQDRLVTRKPIDPAVIAAGVNHAVLADLAAAVPAMSVVIWPASFSSVGMEGSLWLPIHYMPNFPTSPIFVASTNVVAQTLSAPVPALVVAGGACYFQRAPTTTGQHTFRLFSFQW